MCCLFGFVDYGHQLTRKQRSRLLSVLSVACEDRGTDATGIAYNHDGRQYIYKRPLAAHLMWYRVPTDATVVMGHTRMTTQGSEKHNENNHPFRGNVGDNNFALAHNGVLYNDKMLQKEFKLPATKIETDSYVAVQLLEKFGRIDFEGLRSMAEMLEGSFCITLLTEDDKLYFIKGNNPMCIYHFPEMGIYIYASTEEILQKALMRIQFRLGTMERVRMYTGEILCIDAHGKMTHYHFDDSKLYSVNPPWTHWGAYEPVKHPYEESDYEKAFNCRYCFRRNKIKKYPTFAMAEQAARDHLCAILPSYVPVPERIEMNDMLTVKKLAMEFKNKEGHYENR